MFGSIKLLPSGIIKVIVFLSIFPVELVQGPYPFSVQEPGALCGDVEKAEKLLRGARRCLMSSKNGDALVALKEAKRIISKVIRDIEKGGLNKFPPLDNSMGPGIKKLIKRRWPDIGKGKASIALVRVNKVEGSMDRVLGCPVTPQVAKVLVGLLPKYVLIRGKIEKVYWVGKKRNLFGKEVSRKDLVRGAEIFLEAKMKKELPPIEPGNEYWMVFGPPFSVNLENSILGGGRSMVLFLEKKVNI